MALKIKDSFILFVKGIFMGIADVIPGISGGTIAFITGIYSELIKSIKDVGDFIKEFFEKILKNRGKWKNIFSKLNFAFFIPLILGIWLAFGIGVHFIPQLIQKYPAQVMGLFSGLIISTAFVMLKEEKNNKPIKYIWTFLGLLSGFFISQLTYASTSPTYFFIFLSGIIAICAMILPGISGAYLLLVLGQYEFMLNAIRHIFSEYLYVLAFSAGCVIGLLSFSNLLNYLLKKHKASTILFLVGLMIGALYGPVKTTLISNHDKVFEFAVFLIFGAIIFLIIDFIKLKIQKNS